ncbi:TadE/TadG family type IV pilus assembly protein [Sanguibacter suarezii]|uniref:TadE/TadG family type IV pilus assembly protein n=1 Tax=Sanguibacter suarezii TaxID=60921 RepID=UPI000A82EF39|nr:TadE family protein [Sanguibacter suarezii]
MSAPRGRRTAGRLWARAVGDEPERGSMAIELVGFVTVLVFATILLVQGFMVVTVISSAQQAARDGARAQMGGGSATEAVYAQLPDWVTVQDIRTGAGAVAGCAGRCVAVEVRVPLGLPGWSSKDVTVVRTAELPEE